MRHARVTGGVVVLMLAALPAVAEPPTDPGPVFSVYAAQISGERTWQKLITEPGGTFIDAYLIVGTIGAPYAQFRNGALQIESEGQLVYNFGAQDHWEINVVPIVTRWRRFPWSERIATSAAFGLGLSYATDLPEMEHTLEGDSRRLLVHWFGELTAGPAESRWALTLRLHHRSNGFGLLAPQGGMNALGLGVRMAF